MRRPRHAAEDGSFGRSAGMAAGRGAVLLAVAVVLGVVLLNAADDPPPERVAAGASDDDGEGDGATSDTSVPDTTVPVTVPVRSPQEVKVLPTNATTVKGVAGKARDVLQAAGFNVLAPTDARRATASNVYFATLDYEREAQAVAAVLGLPSTSVAQFPAAPPLPVTDGKGANVIVVVGPELAEQLAARGTSTSSTTAAGATTSTTRASSSTTAP